MGFWACTLPVYLVTMLILCVLSKITKNKYWLNYSYIVYVKNILFSFGTNFICSIPLKILSEYSIDCCSSKHWFISFSYNVTSSVLKNFLHTMFLCIFPISFLLFSLACSFWQFCFN